jgi:hypothetical protein
MLKSRPMKRMSFKDSNFRRDPVGLATSFTKYSSMGLPSVPEVPLSTFDDLVANIHAFDIALPTRQNRVSDIVSRSNDPQNTKAQILKDAINTRVIVHYRVFELIDEFLQIKAQFGSAVEKSLYKEMTQDGFIRRLILKRPLSFMGANDDTLGRDGRMVPNAANLWRQVGTGHEKEPLVLGEYLSYDEMALSALIGASSPTYFINSGGRFNCAAAQNLGEYTERGIYVSLVGPRFEIPDQMESRFLIADANFCTNGRGYGYHSTPATHDQKILQMWARFYGVQNAETGICGFPVESSLQQPTLNIDRYKQRIGLTLETFLLEAEARGKEFASPVHAFLVGLGLGVWQIDPRQAIAYVQELIATISRLSLSSVQYVELSWVVDSYDGADRMIVPAKDGNNITLLFTRDDPARKRAGNRLLVACYAWDGNSFPGNEVWRGSLSASGDPAAVCCSTVGELQNPYVNPFWKNICTY